MRRRMAAIVGVGFILGAAPAWAHHSFAAEYDANKPIKFTGTVTKVEWVNPHSWIHVDVKKPDGTVENWAIEGATPNSLFRRGVTKTLLTVGTEIVVDGFQGRDGKHRANGRDITFADGRRVFLGSSGTGAPEDGKDPTEKK